MRNKKLIYVASLAILVFGLVFILAGPSKSVRADPGCKEGPDPNGTADQVGSDNWYQAHTGVWTPSLTATFPGRCVPVALLYPPSADPSAFTPDGINSPGYSGTGDYSKLCSNYQQYLVPNYETFNSNSSVILTNRHLPAYGQPFQGYPEYTSSSGTITVTGNYSAYLCPAPTSSHPTPIPVAAVAPACTSIYLSLFVNNQYVRSLQGQNVCDYDVGLAGGMWASTDVTGVQLNPGSNSVCLYYSGVYATSNTLPWGRSFNTNYGLGWCSTINYLPPVSITGGVYTVDSDGKNLTLYGNGIYGNYETCVTQGLTKIGTPGGQTINFTMPQNADFCLRVPLPSDDSVKQNLSNYDGPFIAPSDGLSYNSCSISPAQVAATLKHCEPPAGYSYGTYEKQHSGTSNHTGYNFIYIKKPQLTCGVALSPRLPQAGQPFSVNISTNYSDPNFPGSTMPYSAMSVTLNGSTRNLSGGSAPDSQTTSYTIAAPGSYSGTVTVGSVTCPFTANVGSQPYLKIYGNDAAVGSAMPDSGNNCKLDNPKATILTLDNVSGGHNTTYTGSSTQLAAFALGQIASFFSAGQQSPGLAPTGLTFGNYGQSGPVSGYGGNSGMSRCTADYLKSAVGSQPAKTGFSGVALSSISAGGLQYYKPSGAAPFAINADQPVNGGEKLALVVDGDAYISNNIVYGPYGSVAAMPSFYLIVRGNIYIDSSVTQLSGVYIAQPKQDGTGGGGTIFTCSNATQPIPASQLYASCNQQLTINGAFIAKNVKFLRSFGSRSQSTANEGYGSTQAAEIFKASPQMYLSLPSALQKPGAGSTYDSITSLPPIL